MRSPTQIASFVWSGRPRPLNARGKVTSAGSSNLCRLLVLALLAIPIPLAKAQRIAPATHTASPSRRIPPPFHPSGRFAFAGSAHPSSRFHHSSPSTSFLSPFFGDSFNPEDFSSTGDSAASQASSFLVPAARALSGSTGFAGRSDNAQEPSSSQPLLIELQGDRYVRVSSAAIDGEALPLSLAPGNIRRTIAQPPKSTRSHFNKPATRNSANASATVIAAASPARDLPAAVLVFRDGHSEEVRDYTIADGFLYARGDYYTDGYWNRKIDLSTLDLSQTLQTNSTRNVKFVLPSSPNEVITRP